MKAIDYNAHTPQQIEDLGWFERKLIRVLNSKLNRSVGTLHLTLPSGYRCSFGDKEPVASLKLNNFRPLLRLLTGGINGWSESYLAGEWDSPDLTSLVRWALRYEAELDNLSKARAFTGILHNLYHRRRDNSRKGSRKNIAAHYDLGNEFYSHWLDPGMTYSAALFKDENEPLEQAQHNKYARILELLDAKPGDHIAEIGCGWGGFVTQAAQEHQLKVHGVTLSKEQLAWAKERVNNAGLSEQVHLSLTDYRDLNHRYDGIVSIEMFEAVGEAHWDTYFETLKKILKPGGRVVLQVISIDNDRFHSYRKQADFIQRYVFPGGMLPSVEALHQKFDQHGFELKEQQLFGMDYARTLELWAQEFENHWQQIKPLGFDNRFYRLWRYYLAYCQGGFEQGSIDVGFYVLER